MKQRHMVKAYILVVTDAGATRRIFDELTKVPSITELNDDGALERDE
jgi:hypothetical protein